MSENTLKRIETWSQVAILIVTIVLHAIATEVRLAKVEQKVDDMMLLLKVKDK